MQSLFTIIGVLLFFGFGIAQFWLGYLGIEETIGWGWAVAALFLAFTFRMTLPLTIGTFFGVTEVLHWHWFWALLIAAPGLALAVPGILATLLTWVVELFHKSKAQPSVTASSSSYAYTQHEVIDVEIIDEDKPNET
ncbi:MAG: hypothetical protein AB7E85_07080 [Pseudobdellovibrionaceae bacterium]